MIRTPQYQNHYARRGTYQVALHLLHLDFDDVERLAEQLALFDWWCYGRHGGEALPQEQQRDCGEDAPLAGGRGREKSGRDGEESE